MIEEKIKKINLQCLHCGSQIESGEYCCLACSQLHQHSQPINLSKLNPEYLHLDLTNFKEHYLFKNQHFNYLFYIEGLHCSSCVHLLEKLPEFNNEILDAEVNFGQSQLYIKLSEQGSLARAAQSIAELGYQPSLINPNDPIEAIDEKFKIENRQFMRRIGVAGACTGNIMLFVIPIYAGLTGTLATVFSWISFLLYLPILFYSAVPFYVGAWNSLKYKVINVDLPIVLAMLASIGLSVYNLIRGDENIYFDSTASFMFLILSARYVLKRFQQKYLGQHHINHLIKDDHYELFSDHSENTSAISIEEIKPYQKLRIKEGQTLPVDGILSSSSAMIDTSMFDGEPLPKIYSDGMTVYAGMKVLSKDVVISTLTNSRQSRLGQLLNEIGHQAVQKTHFIGVTDRLAQYLIVSVFSIALFFFLWNINSDFSMAFNRSLALIVLACPCALAFGSPLAFGLAIKMARKYGILIKNGTSLERMNKIKNIFFDKTGTLTTGELRVVRSHPQVLDVHTVKIILSLEKESYHPIAFALRNHWSSIKDLYPIKNFNETVGQGISGEIAGKKYELRSSFNDTKNIEAQVIQLIEDDKPICDIYFADQLRPESSAIVDALQKINYQCFLLSGDKIYRTLEIAQKIGIPKNHSFGELFPEDKKNILKKYSDTLMIGDGANDSLSLVSADVGIAIKGSMDISLQSADIYFTKDGLSPLITLIEVARRLRKTLFRNLTFSLIYNLLGGTLALTGNITPMTAAILMPISSLIILLSSIWGFRE